MMLENRVALITGGAQGLGKAIAIAMAKEGARVAICDINPETLKSATLEIAELGTDCLDIRCDVFSSESVRQMFAQLRERFGTVHILVNNAALTPSKPVDEERRGRFYALVSTPIPRQSRRAGSVSAWR